MKRALFVLQTRATSRLNTERSTLEIWNSKSGFRNITFHERKQSKKRRKKTTLPATTTDDITSFLAVKI